MAWVENFQQLFKESESGERILMSGEMELRGDVLLTGPGSVSVRLEGSLESLEHLTIDDVACISGPCRAKNLHVSGQVEGDLHSQEHLRMAPGAVIHGQVQSATLEITPDAEFEGSLQIGASSRE